MESFPAAFQRFNSTHHIFERGQRILLAVSGGIDSMVMARLFKDDRHVIGIAHVNFNLRGVASDEDAALVERTAKRWKVPFHPLNADTRTYMKTHKLSLQEAAREIRYNWFEQVAEHHDYDKIATAHHLDDSIETFFINLLRGTGIHGLGGIPLQHGKIIRPMLFATAEQIRSYASKKKLLYREDASNAKDDYLRNRIRHHLIPLLLKLQPGIHDIMGGNLSRLRFAQERFDERMDELHRLLLHNETEGRTISIPEVLSYNQPEALLHELLLREGAIVKESSKLLVTGRPGKSFTAGNRRIVRDRNKLILDDSMRETGLEFTITTLPAELSISPGIVTFKKKRYKAGDEKQLTAHTLMLDAGKLKLPVKVRPWQTGDRFRPLGMRQQKKISDFLTDLKLSVVAKSQTFVLVQGSEICCILGLRISDLYKVDMDTETVVLISQHPVHP